MVKVSFLGTPHTGRYIKSTEAGVWIDSLELAAAIQRAAAGVGHAAIPPDKQFIKGRTHLFLPFTQIEWILSDSPPF